MVFVTVFLEYCSFLELFIVSKLLKIMSNGMTRNIIKNIVAHGQVQENLASERLLRAGSTSNKFV